MRPVVLDLFHEHEWNDWSQKVHYGVQNGLHKWQVQIKLAIVNYIIRLKN
jgi:hypothetical protein